MPIKLDDEGERIVRRGGADDQTFESMLMLEVMSRAPGLEPRDYIMLCATIAEEYGLNALDAIRTGHVQFEERPAGERVAEKPEDMQ